MAKPKKTATPDEKYDALFATTLRAFMEDGPVSHEHTTQKTLGAYLGVKPQTVSYYCMGESLPNCEQVLKIADFFGVTADFLLTGRRVENQPVREMLGLSDSTVENMKLVKDGYFEDSPYMLAMLDFLLGNKDFYLTLEKTTEYLRLKDAGPQEMEGYYNWKAMQIMEDYLLNFLGYDLQSIYQQKRGDE